MKYQNLSSRIVFISAAIFSFAMPAQSYAAGLAINEIMYDLKEGSDSCREWIEIFNAGTSALDLSTFKLYESGTAHAIKSSQGNTSIPAGGYGVIADTPEKFLADNPGFSGNLFDSTFSLSNAGETISLKDSTNAVVDSLSYSSTEGGAGDGSTLGKIGQAFVSTNPTPGSVNAVFTGSSDPVTSGASAGNADTSTASVESDASDSTGDTSESYDASNQPVSSISTTSYPSDLVSIKDDSAFKVGAGRNRLVSVHAPVIFSAVSSGGASVTSGAHNQALYEWSFGDGVQGYGQVVEHTYLFPGQYNVVLVAEGSPGSKVTSRTKVFVREGAVSIKDNLLGQNGYVTLSNSSKEEVNVGGWTIGIPDGREVIPTDTILSPQSSLRLAYSWPNALYADSHKVMRLLSEDKLFGIATSTGASTVPAIPEKIDLLYPDGTLATSTESVRVDPSIDSSIESGEKENQISLIRNLLASLQAKLLSITGLSASSTVR